MRLIRSCSFADNRQAPLSKYPGLHQEHLSLRQRKFFYSGTTAYIVVICWKSSGEGHWSTGKNFPITGTGDL